jgi:ribosome-associated protein
LDIAKMARTVIKDGKASDVLLFNVGSLSAITDFYLVASGNSTPHLKALAEAVRIELKKEEILRHRIAGAPESGWLVLDYFDVVIHLFLPETRIYYAIEDLWHQAPRVR